MKTYSFLEVISMENLQEAYKKARKRKSYTAAVQEFDKHWQLNLVQLYKKLATELRVPLAQFNSLLTAHDEFCPWLFQR